MEGQARILLLALVAGFLSAPCLASDHPSRDERSFVELGGIVSVQLPAFEDSGAPYLDHGLGGTVAGLRLAWSRRYCASAVLAFEVSSTVPYTTSQTGRFVMGPGPSLSRGRDTLASALLGADLALVRLLAGVSAV